MNSQCNSLDKLISRISPYYKVAAIKFSYHSRVLLTLPVRNVLTCTNLHLLARALYNFLTGTNLDRQNWAEF